MNKQERDLLLALNNSPFINQRLLSETSGYSLGIVNRCLKELLEKGYLNEEMQPTELAKEELEKSRPERAVILAAGYGMRMIPINTETPKGLLQVNGETLIERMIRQLQEVGVRDITVVTGFMKEAYEFLIDQYGIQMVINMDYASKNNLHSMALVKEKLRNAYVVPCDIWCEENPFHRNELYPWYMVCDLVDDESNVRVNRKQELVRTELGGNRMVGIAYITGEAEQKLQDKLGNMDVCPEYQECFWEEALFDDDRMYVAARMVPSQKVYEINTYEELRELDASSKQLDSRVLRQISEILQVPDQKIESITVLKKGMTNRSFLFSCEGQRYIMRIPGEGTGELINRQQEYAVYQALADSHISDQVVYMNPENGYKMTRYLEQVHNCDANDQEEVRKCMVFLRKFHEKKLQVTHAFDLFEKLEFYEALWKGADSCFRDYRETKRKVYELKKYIDKQPKEWTLTHIDAVPDNFLIADSDESEIHLIDWEYAGMQDPHVDIAMFAIYAMYDRAQVEALIDAYFPEGCSEAVRRKIYCYIAVCGLLWSNWCEYKRQLGVEFGEYSIRQYRYAKEYYRIFQEEQNGISG